MPSFFMPVFIIVIFFALAAAGLVVPAIVLSIILTFLSVKIVTPNTVKTVEFLGKFSRLLRPGLNFIIPFIEWTRHQDLFRKNLAVEVDGISSDNVTVYVGLNVIYYVEDDKNDSTEGSIYRSVYSINDPRTLMASTIDEQLRAMVSTFDHKEIFNKREEIGETIEQNLRVKLAQFGYTLDSIQVRSIKLEGSVMAAMNRVVESLKIKEAALNE
jgi:regulator of protease activity HflC (stomatin/prohibitin superfamily)